MSSPTPETFALKAAQARKRAERSRFLVKFAALAGAALAISFIGQSLYYKAQQPADKQTPIEKSPIIAGGYSNFSGIDKFSKPFVVRSENGVQDTKIESLMHLKTVTGSFVRRGGGDVQVLADAADYDTKTKDLSVAGHVRFEEPGRYVAFLQTAQVNLEQQKISTNQPVQVKTAGATISADSMETSEDGSTVNLRGNVKAHFQSSVGVE